MLGTIVNAAAVLAGGLVGLLIKGGLREKYKEIVMQAISLAVLFLGASSALSGMLDPDAQPVLFIISLVIGSGLGTLLDLDYRLQYLGDLLQAKLGGSGSDISQGFVTASLLFCVGTMSILGALESGIQGVHTTLFVKSVLDGTAAIIFASTLGVGVVLSAGAVFCYQGILTMLARFIQPFLTTDMIREISLVGGILIFALGLNMMEIKKIKVANMLPAILVPVVYYLYLPFGRYLMDTFHRYFF